MVAPVENWMASPPPHIKTGVVPAYVVLAMSMALRAVDQEIERTGAVSVETANLVKAARGLYKIYT